MLCGNDSTALIISRKLRLVANLIKLPRILKETVSEILNFYQIDYNTLVF